MDGYALRARDVAKGAHFRLIGEAPAGAPYAGQVGPGECVKIATGGIVPAGADRVVIQENVTRSGDEVVIDHVSGPAFIRPRAMDFASGQILLDAGRWLDPAAIGLAAAAGLAQVQVARRPRVAILASGDELIEPGLPLVSGAIFNSATFALAALIEEWGAVAVRAPALPDDLNRSVAAIRALDHNIDVFVPLGGASVGERDLFRPAFEAVGAKMQFCRINVVPGKPSWHARLPDRRPVLGLPGNPSSAFVCAHLLLRPLLDRLLGREPGDDTTLQTAILANPLGENGAREAWLRATVSIDATGLVQARTEFAPGQRPSNPAIVRQRPGSTFAGRCPLRARRTGRIFAYRSAVGASLAGGSG